MGLASPTAVTVGIGRGADFGILVKNGEALEISEKLTTILFDKTGTLTKGKPEVTDIFTTKFDNKELLKLTASIERNSQHPLGQALVRKAKNENIELIESQNFNTISGKGVTANIKDKSVIIGNRALLEENGYILSDEYYHKISELGIEGKTAILIGVNNELAGIIAIADTLKENAIEVINDLKKMKLNVGMITGDNEKCRGTATG